MRGIRAGAVLLACLCLAPAAQAETYSSGGVEALVDADRIVLRNGLFERSWARAAFATERLTDLRQGGADWGSGDDFELGLPGGAPLASSDFSAQSAAAEPLERGGLRLTIRLEPKAASGAGALLSLRYEAEAYPDVAGMRTRITVESAAPLALSGATLARVPRAAAGPAQLHAFRAGADWREPGWAGPALKVGDAHPGTWRQSSEIPAGESLEGPAQWAAAADGSGRRAFLVLERADLPSSRGSAGTGGITVGVQYSHDVIVLGPFEEQGHIENGLVPAGRMRVAAPGKPLALEPVFTGFGLDSDDEAWQFHRYLTGHRLIPYDHSVIFNTNGTDQNRISTGAKDDVDMAEVQSLAPVLRDMGVETFVLDDGWQAASGDWEPDSPQHPEPRGTYPARFPDADFTAVREAIAPMKLGLWMSPMHFNPAAKAYKEHPEWACAPVGHALAAYNALQPDEGSNEAGLGEWSAAAIPHIEARIRHAIEQWQVRYFKFDFLAWLDCVGEGSLYSMREEFVAMLDRLQAAHPEVTFQIDETNDYRLFPFESVTRGPSWFQNGSPEPSRLLHNIWNLSPWIPAFSLGQHVLGGRHWQQHPVATIMAASLLSHVTIFNDPRDLPAEVRAEAATWFEWYRDHRGLLDGVVHPLLADPLAGGWTALQSWDHEAGEGALLAFRQDAQDSTQTIALRGIRGSDAQEFELRSAPGNDLVGTVTAGDLRAGIEVSIPAQRGASVLAIRRTG